MDVKKVTPFKRKDIKVLMKDGTIFVRFFDDYAEDEDVDVDTIQLENQELWGDWLKEIPVPDIQSIEVVE